MLPPRALTFIGLNIVRALSIIALLLVFSSNIVTLVHDIQAVNRFLAASKTVSAAANSTISDMTDCDYIQDSTVPNQAAGIFWAVLNRLLIIGQTVVLLLSEFGWPAAFFNRFFPVLGKDFGVGALGVIQCLIGAAVLSHHVDDFTLVAAFFLFSLGCLNILVGLIFRESAKSKRSVTSWREQAKSTLPTHVAGLDIRSATPHSSIFSDKHSDHSRASSFSGKPSMGFGRQGEKAAALNGYFISKPVESLPRYAAAPVASGSGNP
ncbi:hypothetical protein C8J56DRAFT_789259 [Mycena floridula]|nr:hypothetical protein C8J56DRAFT_789259 [Mycena floridula]